MVSVAAGDGLAYLLQNAAPEGVIALGLGAAAEGGGVGNRLYSVDGHAQDGDGFGGHVARRPLRLAPRSHLAVALGADPGRRRGFKHQAAVQCFGASGDCCSRLPGEQEVAHRRFCGVPGLVVVQGLAVQILALGGVQQHPVRDGLHLHQVQAGQFLRHRLGVIHAKTALQPVGWVLQAVADTLQHRAGAEVHGFLHHATFTPLASHVIWSFPYTVVQSNSTRTPLPDCSN